MSVFFSEKGILNYQNATAFAWCVAFAYAHAWVVRVNQTLLVYNGQWVYININKQMCLSVLDKCLKCGKLLEILQFKLVFALKCLKSDLGVIQGEFRQLLDSCLTVYRSFSTYCKPGNSRLHHKIVCTCCFNICKSHILKSEGLKNFYA